MKSNPDDNRGMDAQLRGVWEHLGAGRLEAAKAILRELPVEHPSVISALAALVGQEGDGPKALDLLRPLVFPGDRIMMDPQTDPSWRANFCLALLRSGNQDGFVEFVPQLAPPDHPGVRALQDVLARWQQETAKVGWLKRLAGKAPRIALPEGLPAGWPDTRFLSLSGNVQAHARGGTGSTPTADEPVDLSPGRPPSSPPSLAAPPPRPLAPEGVLSTVSVWRARPVFISSALRDMHAERDRLRTHVFPRLGEPLRARGHYLDPIDLRQGVESTAAEDEATREVQVLKVCLDEVERSRPFLVALLGDCYGWVPPAERIAAAARDAGIPAAIEVEGRSVTELEILYGVLTNPDQRRRSWFYFRTLDRTGLPPEVAARFPAEEPSDDPQSPAARLRTLKDRIRQTMPDRVREYTLRWDAEQGELAGLPEFDEQVARDLWADLEAETAEYLRDAPRTWPEADAQAATDFVAERTRGYVERPAVTDPMLDHALSPAAESADWGLVVTGASGAGKSSLFGRVFLELLAHADAGDLVLLDHAAGIFPRSGEVDRMLRRWVTELAAHLGVPDPLEPDTVPEAPEGGGGSAEPPSGRQTRTAESPAITSEQIEKTFAELLGRVSAEVRVVVLIDALDQFEPTARAEHLTWLPALWPANVRLLATAAPGPASVALTGRRGCRELPVPPVTADEAREIARRFCRERRHRDVNPRVLEALRARTLPDGRPAHGNPLWLALALQEMNLLEADDYERAEREFAHLRGAARMEALQVAEAETLAADVPGVYGELLARAERGFGKAWADAFTGLIAVSRAGWRESDLRELMPRVSGRPWDDLAFADVRRAMGRHVVQRGAQAQWDFFHAALRETVLARDLADESARCRLHGLIADHLESLPPDDPLRISETMVHLLSLGDRDRARAAEGNGRDQ